MSYQKPFVTILEAAATCGRDIDSMMSAAGEGHLKTFVIADDWPLADAGQALPDYVELLPRTLLKARVANQVIVREVVVPNVGTVRLASEQAVPLGAVYVLRDEALKLMGAPQPTPSGAAAPVALAGAQDQPGERATLNLERTIGALVHLIARTPESEIAKHRTSDDVNAKQLAESLWTHLEAHGFSTTDLSVRSLQDRIIKGLKALKRY